MLRSSVESFPMEDRRPIEPLLVRLIAELRKPIHESSVDPSMFIVHAGLWSSNRKEERSLVINPSSIPTQSTGLSSTVMSLNGPTCTMGLGHHQTYQKDDVTSLASCAAYTKRGLERLKVLKEKSEELAPIRDALDFSSGLLPPSPAVDSTDQFAHSNVQEQRSTPNSEAVLLPNFESVSYDRVQDLYEQRKGTLYFIPEGFEPVLVPNDTKAQTVTNLLETAKQVSAPLNVPRMLPDADVPLPTPLRYSRSLKPNAFFFYRRAKLPALRNAGMKCSEALAKISCMWREETPEVRLMFEKMAEDARQEHMKGYPEYPYKGYSEYPYKGYSEYPYKWYSEYPYKGYSEYQFRRTLVAKNTGITKLEHTLQQIDAEHSSRPNKPYTVAETRLNPVYCKPLTRKYRRLFTKTIRKLKRQSRDERSTKSRKKNFSAASFNRNPETVFSKYCLYYKSDNNKEWLRRTIEKGLIDCWPENDIKLSKGPIAHGAYGVVFKGMIEASGTAVAVKTLIRSMYRNDDNLLYKAIVKELKNHKRANDHVNIIQFLGLCKDEEDHYHMVFEYAKDGTLRQYLMKYFPTLTWERKYKLGLDIANGLSHLHDLDIVHKDLSSSNILIHNGTAKITDFGLSTMLVQLLSESRGEGTAAYRDPVSFRDPSYRRKKESDVFSLGVMLWEISSGKVPCEGCKSHEVPKYREKGFRDPPSFETPETYVRLYEKCWEEDPYKRPICKEVYRQLRNMYEIQICQNQNMAIEALDLSYEHMNIGDRPLMPALESSSSIAALPNYCSA